MPKVMFPPRIRPSRPKVYSVAQSRLTIFEPDLRRLDSTLQGLQTKDSSYC